MFYPIPIFGGPLKGLRATETNPKATFRDVLRKVGANPPKGFVVLGNRGLVQLRLAWGVRGSQERLAGQETMSGVPVKSGTANSSTMRGGNDARSASETACQ